MRNAAPWTLVAAFALGGVVAVGTWWARSSREPPRSVEQGRAEAAPIPRPRLLAPPRSRHRREGAATTPTPTVEGGPQAAPVATTLRITGSVLDPDGAPVAGARVWTVAAPPAAGEAVAAEPAGVTTDTEGRFDLPAEGAEARPVVASAPGFARSEPWGVAAPASDVVLRLERGVRLDVRVEDAEGNPVPDAWVTSEERDPAYPWIGGVTGRDGRVAFVDLPAVRRTVGVAAHGFARASREDVLFGGPELRFVLEPERSIRLRVHGADGAVIRPRVQVLDARSDHAWHEVRETEDGLDLLGLGSGPYVLILEDEAHARRVLRGVRGGDPPIDVALDGGMAIAGRLPLADAGEYVYAVRQCGKPRGPVRHPLRRFARPAWVEIGANTFRIPGLKEGTYDLLVVVGQDGSGPSHDEVGGVVVPDVPAGAADVEVRLPKGESIEGTGPTDRGAGRELVEVQAYDERGLCRAFTQLLGRSAEFHLRGLPAGRYLVVAWYADGTSSQTEIEAPTTGAVLR